jgi:hypothetical protein
MDTKENGNLIPSQVIYVDDLIKNAISRSLKFTFFLFDNLPYHIEFKIYEFKSRLSVYWSGHSATKANSTI